MIQKHYGFLIQQLSTHPVIQLHPIAVHSKLPVTLKFSHFLEGLSKEKKLSVNYL